MVLVIIGIFAGALFLALYVGHSVILERSEVNRTLRSLGVYDAGQVAGVRRQELARSFVDRALVPGMYRLGRSLRALAPQTLVERIARNLVYAGSPAAWDAERVLAVKFVAGGIGGVLGSALALAAGAGPARVLLVILLLGAVGFFGPDWMIKRKASQRQEAIRRALPDTLDQLAISVEAGLGFDSALGRVAAESKGPLAEELNRALREMQLGTARADTLRALADRSNVDELKSFVLAMIQADQFGVSIGHVLEVQARELRVRRRQRAEEKAQKVPVKMVFPLLLCIFPALFVVVIGPGAINIYNALIR